MTRVDHEAARAALDQWVGPEWRTEAVCEMIDAVDTMLREQPGIWVDWTVLSLPAVSEYEDVVSEYGGEPVDGVVVKYVQVMDFFGKPWGPG